MAWGHRLKRLTRREREECSRLGWGCGAGGCAHPVEFISTYSYVSAHGHAAHARRPFCAAHGREFAMRHTLAWPTRDGRVRIRWAALTGTRSADRLRRPGRAA